MSKQSTIQVRVESELKEQAEELFSTLGTSLPEAVRLFLAQSVHDRALPFTPSTRRAEGDDRAFGALAHYASPALRTAERETRLKARGDRRGRR